MCTYRRVRGSSGIVDFTRAGNGRSYRAGKINFFLQNRGLTFGEIGQRFGFTRARVHKVTAKALQVLRKTWGPRVPRLLDKVKHRLSLSNASELTPALLEQWVDESSRCLRLSRQAHVRLIAELDADILLSTKKEFL